MNQPSIYGYTMSLYLKIFSITYENQEFTMGKIKGLSEQSNQIKTLARLHLVPKLFLSGP